MTPTNSMNEDQLDGLIRLAMSDDELARKAIDEFDQIDTTSVEFDQAYEKRRANAIRRERWMEMYRGILRPLSHVAVFLLCFITVSSAGLLTVSAIKSGLWSDYMRWAQEFFVLDVDEPVGIPSEIEAFREPTYMPHGVEKRVLVQDWAGYFIDYHKDDVCIYSYSQRLWDGKNVFDNTDIEARDIQINGNSGLLIVHEQGEIQLVWSDDEYYYSLYAYGQGNLDEFLKIAESVS